MKKALMTAMAMGLGIASAASSSNTSLNFRTTVVSGCSVTMSSSYTNTVVPTYNGTMGTPTASSISTGTSPIMRCQTGTGVTIRSSAMKDATASNDSDSFTGQIDSPASSSVTLTGIMSLRLQPAAGANNYNDDNKTLDGAYRIVFTKSNIAGGNGDTYGLTASFAPTAGQFEAMVGDYVGTVNVTVEY